MQEQRKTFFFHVTQNSKCKSLEADYGIITYPIA